VIPRLRDQSLRRTPLRGRQNLTFLNLNFNMITAPNFFGAELPKKFRVRPISNLFSKENRQITHNSIFADLSHFEIRFGFHRAVAGKGEGGLIQSCANPKPNCQRSTSSFNHAVALREGGLRYKAKPDPRH